MPMPRTTEAMEATPTSAGLMLLPMTLGMMSGSIISGQIISRTGQYRQFPIIGCGLLIGSLFGFHYVGADTALWRTMILMLFFGLGLGCNMQPLTPVSYTHLRAHETDSYLVCRLLLEKKKTK